MRFTNSSPYLVGCSERNAAPKQAEKVGVGSVIPRSVPDVYKRQEEGHAQHDPRRGQALGRPPHGRNPPHLVRGGLPARRSRSVSYTHLARADRPAGDGASIRPRRACCAFAATDSRTYAPSKQNTGTAERVFERLDAGHTRSASKKAVQRAQREATAKTKSSRLQFTEEERSIPELKQYIAKSEKAADRLDAAKAAIPKEKKLVRERVFDEAAGKGKTRLHFEEREKPPNFKGASSPLSRPVQEAGVFVHNKVHSVEKDNSGVEGAHKAEEAAEDVYKRQPLYNRPCSVVQ